MEENVALMVDSNCLALSFSCLFSFFKSTFSRKVFLTILFHLFSHWARLDFSSAISDFIIECCSSRAFSSYTLMETLWP